MSDETLGLNPQAQPFLYASANSIPSPATGFFHIRIQPSVTVCDVNAPGERAFSSITQRFLTTFTSLHILTRSNGSPTTSRNPTATWQSRCGHMAPATSSPNQQFHNIQMKCRFIFMHELAEIAAIIKSYNTLAFS